MHPSFFHALSVQKYKYGSKQKEGRYLQTKTNKQKGGGATYKPYLKKGLITTATKVTTGEEKNPMLKVLSRGSAN